MTYKLIVKSKALADLENAYDYYEEQSVGLGERFGDELEEMLTYLEKYPQHFPVVKGEYRQALINRFPFVVLYKIVGNEVIVSAVFHTSRDPDGKFL